MNAQEDNQPVEAPEIAYRPSLPDWGCLLLWPEGGEQSIFEPDLETARRLVPSRRVFHRQQWDGKHYWLHYGESLIRVAPSMWVQAPACDLDVGQQVELLHRHGENDPGIYRIREITLAQDGETCEFWLRRGDLAIEKSFRREDMRPLITKHNLKIGFFDHSVPSSEIPDDLELLNVGNLLEN